MFGHVGPCFQASFLISSYIKHRLILQGNVWGGGELNTLHYTYTEEDFNVNFSSNIFCYLNTGFCRKSEFRVQSVKVHWSDGSKDTQTEWIQQQQFVYHRSGGWESERPVCLGSGEGPRPGPWTAAFSCVLTWQQEHWAVQSLLQVH